jgi:tripartite-type tricarboxylate transporter receptor subunit TctC
MRVTRRAALGAAAGMAIARPALAFPDRQMSIVVGFAPGSANDSLARFAAERLQEKLGQRVLVENRPGAGGMLAATTYARRTQPDGHTILFGSSSFTSGVAMRRTPEIDLRRDVMGIALLCAAPMALAVNSGLPIRTMPEFIAYAKANPGRLNYGSSGVGGIMHLQAERLRVQAGIDVVHVPYNGGAPAVTGVMANDVQFTIIDASTLAPGVQAGRLRIVGMATERRTAQFPDVATMAEQGFPFEASVWYGLFAVAGTPPAIVTRLNAAANEAIQAPAYLAQMASIGAIVQQMSPEQFQRHVVEDLERWENVVRQARIEQQ